MKTILNLLINSLAVFITSYILSAGVKIDNFLTAILVAIVLAIINTFVKPILVILTLPINVLSLGLFTFVINAVIILLASFIVSGFSVDSFWWALGFSIILTIVSSLLHWLL